MNVRARRYVLAGLTGTTTVIAVLLNNFSSDDPRWDIQPDPERFSLREMTAHLADWDEIWLERAVRIVTEETPELPDVDEGLIAVARDYAHQDPRANLARFATGRAKLVAYFDAVPEIAWSRKGNRPPTIGEIELDALAALILGHDGYHTKQTAEYLRTMSD